MRFTRNVKQICLSVNIIFFCSMLKWDIKKTCTLLSWNCGRVQKRKLQTWGCAWSRAEFESQSSASP